MAITLRIHPIKWWNITWQILEEMKAKDKDFKEYDSFWVEQRFNLYLVLLLILIKSMILLVFFNNKRWILIINPIENSEGHTITDKIIYFFLLKKILLIELIIDM